MPKRSVYLDYAAATPLNSRVLEAMETYFSRSFYNPSASYLAARKIRQTLDESRQRVARVLGAKPSEIIFTAGGSEANNLAIAGIMNNYPKANLIISAIEHPSIYEPAKNYPSKICPVDNNGLVDSQTLKALIDDQTVLVSLIYVSNEIGVIQSLKELSGVIKEVRAQRLEQGIKLPIYLHTDAAQAANYLDLHIASLGVDLMTLNGGKIYGPKQSGALFLKSDVHLRPLIKGGGQERGLRSGTENVAAIVGFSRALLLAQESRLAQAAKTAKLQAYFILELKKYFSSCLINGSLSQRIVNNVHVSFPGVDNEWLLIKLDELGIMAAAGSACSAASVEPSTVLRAIGLSDELARNSIRFSLGISTTKTDLDYTLKQLKRLLGL